MKLWLEKNDIEMPSAYYEENSFTPGTFIRTLKIKFTNT